MDIIVSIIVLGVVLGLNLFVNRIICRGRYSYEPGRAEACWNVICALVSCVAIYAIVEDSMLRILFLAIIAGLYYEVPKINNLRKVRRMGRASGRAAKTATSSGRAKHFKDSQNPIQYRSPNPKESGRAITTKEKTIHCKTPAARHFVNSRSRHR